jgi:hypothetical protein
MTARASTERETWADIVPDVDTYEHVTADELLDYVEEILHPHISLPPGDALSISAPPSATAVTLDTLRYWQKIGVLPHPVRRWHNGATRSLYPKVPAAMAMIDVLSLQDDGFTLQQIAPRLRTKFHWWRLRRGDPFNWRDIAEQLGKQYSDATGQPPAYVQVVFVDSKGEKDVYSYPVGSDHTGQ